MSQHYCSTDKHCALYVQKKIFCSEDIQYQKIFFSKESIKRYEMVEIKRKAFPDKTLDNLFATEETGSEEGRE